MVENNKVGDVKLESSILSKTDFTFELWPILIFFVSIVSILLLNYHYLVYYHFRIIPYLSFGELITNAFIHLGFFDIGVIFTFDFLIKLIFCFIAIISVRRIRKGQKNRYGNVLKRVVKKMEEIKNKIEFISGMELIRLLQEINDELEIDKNKLKSGKCKIFVILSVFVISFMYYLKISLELLFVDWIGVFDILFVCFIVIYLFFLFIFRKNIDVVFDYVIVYIEYIFSIFVCALVLINFLIVSKSMHDQVSIKHYTYGTMIVTDKDTLVSDSNYYYVNQSNNFAFMYNVKDSTMTVIPMSDIKKLIIHNGLPDKSFDKIHKKEKVQDTLKIIKVNKVNYGSK